MRGHFSPSIWLVCPGHKTHPSLTLRPRQQKGDEMKSAVVFQESFGDPPGAGTSIGGANAQPMPLRNSSAAAPAWTESRQLSDAIDVVASLAEQAWGIADKGPREISMFEAFEATFAHMVEYLHHLTIGQDKPCDALAKAATVSTELTSRDVDFLRAVSRRNG